MSTDILKQRYDWLTPVNEEFPTTTSQPMPLRGG